jgi:hypothetical protein
LMRRVMERFTVDSKDWTALCAGNQQLELWYLL